MRIVFCSCPVQEAKTLARSVLKAHLAACVQLLPPMESLYWWKGEICEDQETLILFKTEAAVVTDLKAFLLEHHSYTVPEILSVDVNEEESHSDYVAWVREQVRR